MNNYTKKTYLFVFLFSCLCTIGANAQNYFIQNKGQWPGQVLYKCDIAGGNIFIEKNAILFQLIDQKPFHDMHKFGHYDSAINGFLYRMKFENANLNSTYSGKNPSVTKYNYFYGNNPEKWGSDCKGFQTIYVKDLYKNVDLEIFIQDNNLKYNLISKNGKTDQIQIKYEGVEGLEIENNQLKIPTNLGTIYEQIPLVYTIEADSIKSLRTNYLLVENTVSFEITDKFRKRSQVVIDPVMVFSTFSGSYSDNFGFTATYDNDGNAYAGGAVYSNYDDGNGYPVTLGAFQSKFGGGADGNGGVAEYARDMGIFKTSSNGSVLIYATYIGGRGNDQPHSMVVNSKGELIVLGATYSDNYPTTSGAFDQSYNGKSDIVISKLSADGTQMIASTYVGGSERDGLNGFRKNYNFSDVDIALNYGDEYRGEVIVDKLDHIYIATCTNSNESDFPTINGINKKANGLQDGCVFKFDANLSTINWMTFIGGVGHDACFGIDLDQNNNVFVSGGTTFGLLNIPFNGAVQFFQGGKADGYLVKINANGKSISNATYLGNSEYNNAYFVKLDKYGNVFSTGQTQGAWNYVGNAFKESSGGQFIVKMKNDLSAFVFSTTFGNSGSLNQAVNKTQYSPSAFMVDQCERIFISGWGGKVNQAGTGLIGGNVYYMTTTQDAYQKKSDATGSDFYFAVFSKNMEDLLYASFYGGGGEEHVDGGTSRFDPKGIVYQSICAGCDRDGGGGQPPIIGNVFGKKNNSQNCNNLVFKFDFENLNKQPEMKDTVITISLGDILDYNYTISDPDKYDTLVLLNSIIPFYESGNPLNNKPQISCPQKNIRTLTANIKWTPTCDDINKDTIIIPIGVSDIGCPSSLSNQAKIKILIRDIPVYDPPQVICTEYLGPNSLKIQFAEYIDTQKYFKEIVLVKIMPDSSKKVLKRFGRGEEPSYIDNLAMDNKNINYCYFVYTLNICEQSGDTSYKICSVSEADNPIKPAKLFNVTVSDDDKAVKLKWFKIEDTLDFKNYSIYRKENFPKSVFGLWKEVFDKNDTTISDFAVNTATQSYCYTLRVSDKCGHTSTVSNYGCNIVLSGKSRPFEHDLDWTAYQNWENGVDQYILIREEDGNNNPTSVFTGNSGILSFLDEYLNYDWGAYKYRVQATEKEGNYATSQSNQIRLIQKPIVYVPNAFTPNADLINDTWGIKNAFVKEYHIVVYNRWGQKVFESTDKHEDFDGKYKSITPQDNVFIWQVRYTGWDNSIHFLKGNVTILN